MKTLLVAIVILTILLGNGVEESDTYLYDVSMFPEKGALILPCPEIKIRFNDLSESFKPGDEISLRLKLKTILKNGHSLFWYYPPIHDKNISPVKKLTRKIQNISFNPRIKKFKIKGKNIPYPTLRTMSDDIRGNARSKVSSKLDFDKSPKKFTIEIEDEIVYDDLLRLRGLFLAAENSYEIGPTIIEFSKDGKEWQQLSGYEFVIGKTFLKNISPKRFIRMKDKQYQLSLEIETGHNPTINENDSLIVKLSEDLDANWVSVDAQTVIVKGDGKDQTYSVVPKVSDRSVIFPITFAIPPRSLLTLENMLLKSTTSEIDQLSSGAISIHTKLTGNLDDVGAAKETQLGEKFEPVLFMYPSPEIEERDLLFYAKSGTVPAVSIKINTEQGSYLTSGDKVKIVIPKEVNLKWASTPSDSIPQGVEMQQTDPKTIELNITQRIEEPFTLDKIPFEVPSRSIPLFQLECYISFVPDTLALPVKGEISFGQPSVAMGKPKLINRLQDNAVLNDIIVTEDELVTTLKPGDEIEIIGNEDYFSFNDKKLPDIEIVTSGRLDRNPKIDVKYGDCTPDKIVLIVRRDLDKGESIAIKNIPVSDFHKTGGDIFLQYNINDKCMLTDKNEIRIVDLSLEIAAEQEFIRDLNNLRKTYGLGDLSVKIKGQGKLLDQGKYLVLSLPKESAEWANLNAVDISPSEMFIIKEKSKRSVLLSPTSEIYNEATILIKNLSVRPTVDEFINKPLKISAVEDTTVFAKSNNSITYSYPSLTSLDDQVFFTDDTTWHLYNVDINTRNLENTILPGSKISILLSSDKVSWDTKYDVIQIKGEYAERLEKTVEFDGQACHIVVKDTIRADMFFKISGLHINPIRTADIEFFLKMSLDGSRTICAIDSASRRKRFKKIKHSSDYTEKRQRSIDETTFAMRSGRSWDIRIPDSVENEWDSTRNKIVEVFAKKGVRKSNVSFRSLSDRVAFPDNKTAKISITKGYGTIDQGLQISGLSRKKLFFKGLLLSEIVTDESNSYLELIVETPYGDRTVRSDRSEEHDWDLKINGKTSFPFSEHKKQKEVLEIGIFMPKVPKFGGQGILSEREIAQQSKEFEIFTLLDPLVNKFNRDNPEVAKNKVLKSAKYIRDKYDFTNPKGEDWKVWYYLAWAKWRANDLDIYDQLLNIDDLSDYGGEPVTTLTKDYEKDMEKAVSRGYEPEGRHFGVYRTIKKDDYWDKINDRISSAKKKYLKEGNIIEAEEDFLKILSDAKKFDEISHLSAVANYWLGRIALDLGDIEYDNYDESYPYVKFNDAKKIFKSHQDLLSSEIWLEDSTKYYRNLTKKKIKSRQNEESDPMPRNTRQEKKDFFPKNNTYRFTYSYDNSYTYRIIGESGSEIRLVSTENPESFLAEETKLSLMFENEIQLSRGGDYSVIFSPKQQSLFNLFVSAILIGLIGFGYG
jgi:hypothetical protein|tara:strand:+ start:197 stop:4498 length:4302 start_codon:yes stop_codon:yes gene_type:complete